MTLLPGLAVHGLSDAERERVRRFVEPAPARTVRLVRGKTYLKRSLIDAFAGTLLEALPADIVRSADAETLGVADLPRARAFYERGLGWHASRASTAGIVFFDLGGVALALYDRAALGGEAGLRPEPGGFTLAHSTPFVGGRAKIDAVLGLMNSDTAAFGGTVYGEYAPFSTQFGPSGDTFPGTYFRAGTRLRYLAGLSPKFILFGQMGGNKNHTCFFSQHDIPRHHGCFANQRGRI
jgi:catechol 2,3-dioxygenase-like lactoylglutathione lyase family enzyme